MGVEEIYERIIAGLDNTFVKERASLDIEYYSLNKSLGDVLVVFKRNDSVCLDCINMSGGQLTLLEREIIHPDGTSKYICYSEAGETYKEYLQNIASAATNNQEE